MDNRNTGILNFLDRRWRNFATALSFALFGLGGLSLAFAIIPVVAIISRVQSPDARRNTAQRCISLSFRIYIRIMQGLRAIDIRIDNAERLREDEGKPLLVLANHPSLLDYVFVTSLMSRCDCIVKKDLAQKNPFTRAIIRSAGYIANNDAGEFFEKCSERLAQGRRILIFPEGTRSTPGQPMVLQRGAAQIAIRCRVPVRIIHITCEPTFLTRHQKWWYAPPRRPLFHITVREKIDITPFLENTGDKPWGAVRRLNAQLQIALDPRNSPDTTKAINT